MPAENIYIESLTNGEKIALTAIEITSVPHVSIIGDGTKPVEEIVSQYKIEFAGLLNELYQSYKTMSISAGFSKDISFELLWKTTAVKNQPFNASVRLFIIIRTIDTNQQIATASVESLVKLYLSTLTLQKYEYRYVPYTELAGEVRQVSDGCVKALVKEEKVENLQNQLLPYCYSYDRIPISGNDLSRIVNALIDYPDCAVSMQLIPTIFEGAETAEIDRITQILVRALWIKVWAMLALHLPKSTLLTITTIPKVRLSLYLCSISLFTAILPLLLTFQVVYLVNYHLEWTHRQV